MMGFFLPLVATLALLELPKDLGDLPDWAKRTVMSAEEAQVPSGASVWRLMDDRHLSLDAEDNLLIRRRLVQVVVRQIGSEDASLFGDLSDNEDDQILEFKGWHQRVGGFSETLAKRDLIRMGTSRVNQVSTSQAVHAAFGYVTSGSIIVFESLTKKKSFLGPHELFPVADAFPVRFWNVTLDSSSSKGPIHTHLKLLNHQNWGLNAKVTQHQISLENIPALSTEAMPGDRFGLYPLVLARLEPVDRIDSRYSSWDSFATWYHRVFNEVAYPKGLPEPNSGFTKESLAETSQPMLNRIIYRQVYMSPTRGWVPLNGEEIWRRSYGDCKDMVSCTAHIYQDKGVRVYPTLASIGPGITWQEKDPVNPFFNHLIVAIPLTESLGFDAEVVANGKRFLLFDPTSRQTPFGKLHRGHLGGSVLICTEEGAQWADIPQHAVETSHIRLNVKGKVDSENIFTGQLHITEQGGEWSIRYLANSYSLDQLSEYIQAKLNLPANAWLSVTEAKTEDSITHVTASLRMRDFLFFEGERARISTAFLPAPLPELTQNGHPRRNPLSIPGIPDFQLAMDIALATPIAPNKPAIVYAGKLGKYRYEASGGTSLKLSFSMSLEDMDYPKSRLKEGIQDVSTFSMNFNRDLWDMQDWHTQQP